MLTAGQAALSGCSYQMTAPVLLITGATCAMKDVKQKMKELNVQLDNLCQVLFSCQADANIHTHTQTSANICMSRQSHTTHKW